MANVIYDKYKESLLIAANNVSITDETIKVSLIDSDVEAFTATDQYYSEVEANAVIATATLENVTVVNGVVDADDLLFETVTEETECEALLFWIDTGDANTSHLIAYMDTNINGLPITPDGSNVSVTWSTSGIFKL